MAATSRAAWVRCTRRIKDRRAEDSSDAIDRSFAFSNTSLSNEGLPNRGLSGSSPGEDQHLCGGCFAADRLVTSGCTESPCPHGCPPAAGPSPRGGRRRLRAAGSRGKPPNTMRHAPDARSEYANTHASRHEDDARSPRLGERCILRNAIHSEYSCYVRFSFFQLRRNPNRLSDRRGPEMRSTALAQVGLPRRTISRTGESSPAPGRKGLCQWMRFARRPRSLRGRGLERGGFL